VTIPTAYFSDTSHIAARGAIGAAGLALLALGALHILRPDLDPSRQMISEYAIGRFGWLMTVCFALFAAASGSLFVALMGNTPTLIGRIGLIFLLVAATGLAMGAAFRTDPISTAHDAMTFSGRMHGRSFMIGVPGVLFATLLLSLALRTHKTWADDLPLLSLTAIIWLSLAVMAVAIVITMKHLGVDVSSIVGWTNRLFMACYALWVIVAAWPMAR
jgi:hypothetical protein